MRLLIIHISDIHLRTSADPILGRVPKLISAACSVEDSIDAAVLLCAGDVANTGSEDEYGVAYEFFAALRTGLTTQLAQDTPVYIVVVPGNHDCDLRADQSARDMMRVGVLANPDQQEVANAIVDVCVEAQRPFFDFLDTVASDGMQPRQSPLYYEYRIPDGEQYVEIRCLNTAWLSQRHEVLGGLFFPGKQIPERNPKALATISVLHHHPAWLPPENRRDVQSRLEAVCDIVVSGHEHMHGRRTQIGEDGDTIQLLEGAALQLTDDTQTSDFNVILVETTEAKQRFCRFSWEDNMYAAVTLGDWEVFPVNRVRTRTRFQLQAAFEAELRDPGAPFEKRGHGRVFLPEIFVFPELREISARAGDTPRLLDADRLFDATAATANLLISGAEQSGKTSLAKVLFQRLYDQGYVPLFVDGANFVPQTGVRLREQLVRVFLDEYDPSSEELYRQLDRNQRVVIVDSFHRIRAKPGSAEGLLDELEQFAGRVFLFTNDLAHAFGEIARAGKIVEGLESFTHFRIMPFGYTRRNDLTTKWFMLNENLEQEELARLLTLTEERMEVVLGKNFVPAFPIFILSMLQGMDSESQIDTNASTYGYFYELLIKTSLARNGTQGDFRIRMAYLTRLAYRLFEDGRKDITESELRDFHDEYQAATDLRLDFDRFTGELLERLIVVRHSDVYEFKYQYAYYYFIARHLQRDIASEGVRRTIGELSEEITLEENANILLFLAHLTDDPIVIDAMLATADRFFRDVVPARLEGDVAFVERLTVGLPELEYEERDFREVRREIAQERDEMVRSREHVTPMQVEKELAEVHAEIGRLVGALKTLQILGQTLKNFPDLEAARKQTVARACYLLGYRVLGNTLALLEVGRDELVSHMMDALREGHPGATEEWLLRRANSVVVGLALVSAYGIIKRISQAVGAPHLGNTYERVEAGVGSTASRLTNLSLRLDQISGFPRGEILRLADDLGERSLAFGVLKWMVWTHVKLFPVTLDERQKVFAALGIKYNAPIGARIGNRLLAPSRK